MIGKISNRHSLPAMIADSINKVIIQQGLEPGTKLPSESELSAQYRVSRPTIREAIKLLRAQNIVIVRQGDGTYVSARTGIAEDPLGLRYIKKEALTGDVFEARLLVEPQIAMLAAERATENDLREIGEIAEEFLSIGYMDSARFRLDIQFHTLIAKCSKNSVFFQLMPAILDALEKGTVLPEESHFNAQRMHKEIYEAMAVRDIFRAKSAMETHIYSSLYDLQAMERKGGPDSET